MIIDRCKYCKGSNIRIDCKEEELDTAPMVAVKCADCGKWLSWCPKLDRHEYWEKQKAKEQVENLITSQELEELPTTPKFAEIGTKEQQVEDLPKETQNSSQIAQNRHKIETATQYQIDPELKAELLEYLDEQRAIALHAFVVEKDKALALLRKITTKVANL